MSEISCESALNGEMDFSLFINCFKLVWAAFSGRFIIPFSFTVHAN